MYIRGIPNCQSLTKFKRGTEIVYYQKETRIGSIINTQPLTSLADNVGVGGLRARPPLGARNGMVNIKN